MSRALLQPKALFFLFFNKASLQLAAEICVAGSILEEKVYGCVLGRHFACHPNRFVGASAFSSIVFIENDVDNLIRWWRRGLNTGPSRWFYNFIIILLIDLTSCTSIAV